MSTERKLTLRWRAPTSLKVEERTIDAHADASGKVRLLVLKTNGMHVVTRMREACEKAGLYSDAYIIRIPEGAEFEVWEETE